MIGNICFLVLVLAQWYRKSPNILQVSGQFCYWCVVSHCKQTIVCFWITSCSRGSSTSSRDCAGEEFSGLKPWRPIQNAFPFPSLLCSWMTQMGMTPWTDDTLNQYHYSLIGMGEPYEESRRKFNSIFYFKDIPSVLLYFSCWHFMVYVRFLGGMGLEVRKWCCDKTKVVSAVSNTAAVLCPSVPKAFRPRPQKWSLDI